MRLGPTVNGNAENFLEHAINTLNHFSKDLSKNPSKEELKVAIRDCKNELKKDKIRLTDYVPLFEAGCNITKLNFFKTEIRVYQELYIKYVRKTRIKEN